MNKKVLNLSLSVAALVVLLLTVTNIAVAEQNAQLSAKLGQAQQLLAQMPNTKEALSRLVNRTSQAAANDPALKAVLQKLQLSVK